METARQSKRKENADRAQNLFSNAVKSLAETLEQGQSEGLKFHLQAVAKHRRYSVSNTLLIAAQKPDATHVEGFRTWVKLGRKVKKGEKGILIRAPFVFRKTNAMSGERSDEVRGFRAAYVFDISQTEGDELPALAAISGDPLGHLERLKEYAEAHRIVLAYCDEMDELGRSVGGLVTIKKGLSPAEEFCTLAHEIAHEKLHHTPGEELPKAVKETEAEAVVNGG